MNFSVLKWVLILFGVRMFFGMGVLQFGGVIRLLVVSIFGDVIGNLR